MNLEKQLNEEIIRRQEAEEECENLQASLDQERERNQRLRDQIEEANAVILSLPADKLSTCMCACEYLQKWSVK